MPCPTAPVAVWRQFWTTCPCRSSRGRSACWRGPRAAGKTTLLRSLKPELVPVGRYEGSVEVLGARVIDEGRQTGALSVRESAAGIGFVMQDPGAQIVCDSVWHELAFGLENLGMPQDEMRRRVAEVAHFLGIGPWMHEATETLSGGQKQLVNLAARACPAAAPAAA